MESVYLVSTSLASSITPTAPARVTLPASGTGSAQWWVSQLDWAADVRKPIVEDGRKSIAAYRDEVRADSPSAIRVNIEYEKTEQKRHQLFPLVPQLALKASPRTLRDTAPDPLTQQVRDVRKAIAIFKEVLQRLAGTKGLDTKSLFDMLIFDLLCPTGYAMWKVGYERFEDGQIPVQIGEEPVEQPGAVLGLQEMTQPVYGNAPNVVCEKYFASRISPAKGLIPPDFTGKNYSRDCDWLGYDFYVSKADAKARGWKIPADKAKGTGGDDDNRLVKLDRQGDRSDQLKCREVFFYPARVDGSAAHPEKIRRLIFVDGVPDPVVCEDCKDQRFDARGRLVGGIRTLPIKVLTLRYVSDHPFPPSDCRISRRQSDELSEFRSRMMLQRRRAKSLRWVDIDSILDDKVKRQILDGEDLDIIPVSGDGTRLMGIITDPQQPRDNYTANDYLMSDVNRQWAMGGNSQGVKETGGTTATEIASIAQATEGRLSAEKGAVVAAWISTMEDIAALVQLYADNEDYVEIVGQDGAKSIEAWTRSTIRGEFEFNIVPDSASAPDAAADRDLALNRYNLLANDPFTNREMLVRDTYEAFGADPDRLVVKPQPPPPDDKPKVAISIKGEDLNPMMPQYANVVMLLEAAGVLGESKMEDAQEPAEEGANTPSGEPTGAAGVVDRERLRMSEADNADERAGGLVGVGQ